MKINEEYNIYATVNKNRLFVQLVGKLSSETVKKAADLTIAEVKKLKPGFNVITDISRYVPLSKRDASEVGRAQAFIKQSGVGRNVRVVDIKTNLVANIQFDRTGKEAGYTQDPDVAGSIAEAEKKLDQAT
jgi:hypothetical protein